MPAQHTILKPEVIINQGLGTLMAELKLGRIIDRTAFAQFQGKKNDTVTVRIPALLAAREYDFRNTVRSTIDTDTLVEESITLTFDKMPYSAVDITDEQLTLDITSFGEQVSAPQVNAIARKCESYIGAAMDAATLSTELDVVASDDPWNDLFIPARSALNTSYVPSAGRVLVVGQNVEDWLLTKDESFRQADASGQDGLDALREAIIGRKAGFTVVGNVQTIDPDVAYALHPSAFHYVSGAPVVPAGAPAGATAEYEGFAMRWVRDYDSSKLQDRSVFSAFFGVNSIADERITDEDDPNFGDKTNKNCRAVRINFSQS